MNPYQDELQVALDAAKLARAYLLQEYEHFKRIPNAPADISTHADRQSQELILAAIRMAFPVDALCAEETTATLEDAARTGERVWIVDPIDGTRGFAQKNGEFSVMIAFVENGEIAVGLVQQPAAERLTYAVKGQGCWRVDDDASTPSRCQVSPTSTLGECTLTKSRSREPGKRSRVVDQIAPAKVVETYSAGIKLALIARGEADVYFNYYPEFHDWDICAGHILVVEAGGRVTGARGETLEYGLPGAWQRHGLLATNGNLHEAALAAIAQ